MSVSQVNGSGPWGLPTPKDVGEMLNRIQAAAAPVMPRLQALMARPGATLARDEIIAGLQVTPSTCCHAYRAYCEHMELRSSTVNLLVYHMIKFAVPKCVDRLSII